MSAARCDICKGTPSTWTDETACAFIHETLLELEELPVSEVAEREAVKEKLAHQHMTLLPFGSAA